jgi:hypothetical protein
VSGTGIALGVAVRGAVEGRRAGIALGVAVRGAPVRGAAEAAATVRGAARAGAGAIVRGAPGAGATVRGAPGAGATDVGVTVFGSMGSSPWRDDVSGSAVSNGSHARSLHSARPKIPNKRSSNVLYRRLTEGGASITRDRSLHRRESLVVELGPCPRCFLAAGVREHADQATWSDKVPCKMKYTAYVLKHTSPFSDPTGPTARITTWQPKRSASASARGIPTSFRLSMALFFHLVRYSIHRNISGHNLLVVFLR